MALPAAQPFIPPAIPWRQPRAADADRLSQSRWHVFGDAAREGRVLYVAR